MRGLVVELDVPFLDQEPTQARQAHATALQLPPASAHCPSPNLSNHPRTAPPDPSPIISSHRNARLGSWAVLSLKRPVCIAANNGSKFDESRHIANAYIDRKHFRTASWEVLATAGS